MINIFIYEKGNFLMEYQANIVPKIYEVIIYENKCYQVLGVNHIIKKNVETGNSLCNLDISVACLS